MPLVSVVIPAYNCERFVAEAVGSVLAQTVTDWEILLIDDASTDGTAAVLNALAEQDSRIRQVRNEKNLGVAETRNRGFSLARGRYIALLDGDDAWMKDKLERQLSILEKSGGDLCYTAYSFMDEGGRPCKKPYLVPEFTSYRELLRENVIGCSTVLCKRELLEEHRMRGEYAHEDYVLWLELLRAGCVARGINEPLVRYRTMNSSRSGDKKRAARNRWKVYRDFLGMNPFQAGWAFTAYAVRGLRKHYF